MALFKRAFGWFGVLLLVAAIAAAVVFSWSATGWKALSVPTGSMTLAIPKGSLVITRRVAISSLKVGDVITYTDPFNARETISHRIVKTYLLDGKVPAFVTKGDANKAADVPITEGSVVGQVVWHVPDVGRWLLWSKTWFGIAVLVYVPAALLMVDEVRRLSGYYKLSIPYRLPGYSREEPRSSRSFGRLTAGGLLSIVFVMVGFAFWQPALALLKSNTVTLAGNHLSVTPTSTCSATHTSSTTNVGVSNSSSQNSSSGSATSDNGGSATSGNASNSNDTSTTITIQDGC